MTEDKAITANDEERGTTIEKLNDYLNLIYELRQRLKVNEGEVSSIQHFFFRGQANCDWDITPGIFRENMLAYESELIGTAYLRNPMEFRSFNSDFEKLAKLQHYGLPTRLIDVTSNPLVALYFACQSHKEIHPDSGVDGKECYVPTDGAVYFQRAYCKGYDDIEVAVISHLAGMELRGDVTLELILSELEETQIYSKKVAEDCRSGGYRSLLQILQNDYFVVSNMNNERLIRQSGAFLLAGHYNVIVDENNVGSSVVQKANGGLKDQFNYSFFKIPHEFKSEILEELDFYNINEGALFPELEHQMTYIKSMQSKRPAQTIGHFSKISEITTSSFDASVISEVTNERAKEIFRDVLTNEIEDALFQQCFDILCDNLVIDWYRKEQIHSKMRSELMRSLELTSKYTRISAKEKAVKIVADILGKISESSVNKG